MNECELLTGTNPTILNRRNKLALMILKKIKSMLQRVGTILLSLWMKKFRDVAIRLLTSRIC